MRHVYRVTAHHSSPDYAANNKHVLVSLDPLDGTWSATCRPYGCGKSAATPEAAIRSLLSDNACVTIAINGPIASGEYLRLADYQ